MRITATRQLPIAVVTQLNVATTMMNDAVTTRFYAMPANANGGITPYTWSIASGGLPPGIMLNAMTGNINGTPTMSGTFAFTLEVSDTSTPPQVASQPLSIRVATTLVINATALPDATLNVSYTASEQASGGFLPYTWSITNGMLPSGLTLDAATGTISGTPTETGAFTFTLRVADSTNPSQQSTVNLTLRVN
jgi:hypothetical protein